MSDRDDVHVAKVRVIRRLGTLQNPLTTTNSNCPECGARLAYLTKDAGSTVPCPSCGYNLVLKHQPSAAGKALLLVMAMVAFFFIYAAVNWRM